MSQILPLPSLEIKGYRGIRELRIERLGRANLIVGKNSVGKTSILEAIRLYLQPASLDLLVHILESRDEHLDETNNTIDSHPLAVTNLFNRREAIRDTTRPIEIRTLVQENPPLVISCESVLLPPTHLRGTIVYSELTSGPILIGRSTLRFELGKQICYLILDGESVGKRRRGGVRIIKSITANEGEPWVSFVGQSGIDRFLIGQAWDRIVFTDLEKEIISALQIISPDVERIVLAGDESNSTFRVPVAKLKGLPGPVTIRSLGDGVSRMFGLALQMVQARNGVLLIDEIENGIHYSVQADLWRFLFALGQRLNVQIIATSHSFDMIKAFQIAASENEQEEGFLIRLQRDGEDIRVTEFDEEELEVVARKQIEVR